MTKKNEVALTSQFTKENVPALLEHVNSKIDAIKKPNKKSSSVNGKSLPGFGQLNNITDLSILIQARTSVNGKYNAYQKEVDTMTKEGTIVGEAPEFQIDGCSAEDWLAGIDNRYIEVSHKALLDKLEKGREFLKKHISEEDEFQQDMKEFVELFK